ncbi:MAG: terpene cyclase/mutase family protein [Asgard group archaeon]|nr:terpene cyclase/mutase family protein [Asgard group archaeon]
MLDIQKAVEYITNTDSKIDIAKLNVILENDVEKNKQQILEYFSNLQNEDGGFPYQWKKNQISTINITTSSLHTLLDYGLSESKLFLSGIKFLYNTQNPSGFWNEPQELHKLKPPIWDDPTNELAKIWLTANSCHLLARTKKVDSSYITKGIKFLLENLDENRQLKGYFLSNWIAVAIFAIQNGKEDESTKNFVRIIEENIDKILGSSELTWCLHCFFTGGFRKEHSLVRKMLDSLISIQYEDGRWISVDGEEFNISTTAYTLYILKKYEEF